MFEIVRVRDSGSRLYIELHDHEYFFTFFRMTPMKYEHLLRRIAPAITMCSIRREAIGPRERLIVTLKYIFAGTSQVDLAGMFRISKTSISRIINETCVALWNILLAKNKKLYQVFTNRSDVLCL